MRRLILTSRYVLALPILLLAVGVIALQAWWAAFRRRYAVLTNAPTPAASAWYREQERGSIAALAEIRHVPGRSDDEIVDNLVRSLDKEAA